MVETFDDFLVIVEELIDEDLDDKMTNEEICDEACFDYFIAGGLFEDVEVCVWLRRIVFL